MQDDVVVITGAFGQLGTAVRHAAAARGGRLVLIDHAHHCPEGPEGLVLGGVDLTDYDQARRALDAAQSELGAVHALLNLAGGFRWQTLEEGDLAGWDAMHAINLKTAVNTCRAALPHLKASGAGRIVNVGAASALKAGAGMGAYTASKAGVHKLTESLSEELKADGVTVNAVLPSIIDTPQNRADMGEAEAPKWVKPEDLAAVILFLASREATAVTGALVPVTGRV